VVSGACVGCGGTGSFAPGGDLSGTSTSQTVIGLQGRPVSSTAPQANQVLTWDGSFWTPANTSGTGGGGLTAINGLSNATTSIIGAGGITVSTSSPNVITITGSGAGAITINSLATSTFAIQGTPNQITVATSSPNIISLSLPQNIATTSSPTFNGLTLFGLSSGGSPCLTVNGSGVLATTTCGTAGGGTTTTINGFTTSTFLIQGTANQVTVTTSSPNVIGLGLPQNIGNGSTPTFAGLTISGNVTTTNLAATVAAITTSTIQHLVLPGVAANSVLGTDANGNVVATTTAGTVLVTINGLTTSTFSLQGTANQVTVATTSPNVVTLSLPQNIATTSSPTFNGLTLFGLSSGGSPCLTVNGSGVLATTTCGAAGVTTTIDGAAGPAFTFTTSTQSGTWTITTSTGQLTFVLPSNVGFFTNDKGYLTSAIQSLGGIATSSISLVGGSNITISTTSNSITIAAASATVPTINGITTSTFVIQGTTTQVTVTTSSPNIIMLGLPQGIATSSTPTFAGLTISGLGSSGNPCVSVNASGTVATSTCGGGSFDTGTSSAIALISNGSHGTAVATGTVSTGGTLNWVLVPNGLFTVGTLNQFTTQNGYAVAQDAIVEVSDSKYPGDVATGGGSILSYEQCVTVSAGACATWQLVAWSPALYTPGSSSAACTVGSVWGDANYVYVCTAATTIKRVGLSTF